MNRIHRGTKSLPSSWVQMRKVPDISPKEARSFAEAEEVSENLTSQVERARQALSNYQAAHPVLGTAAVIDDDPEVTETARERAARAEVQPDLHRKA